MSVRRIAVSGGPGAGKTTVWRALLAQHGARLLPVPEVATLMFRHVFPAVQRPQEREAVQRAIYSVQCSVEAFYEMRCAQGQVLLCDRGTPDGGGYWPSGHIAFFEAMQTCMEVELARYDAVLFMETAAHGGFSITEGNETRCEDLAEAVAIDRRLHAVWSQHPRFVHVAHEEDFQVKVARGCEALKQLLAL